MHETPPSHRSAFPATTMLLSLALLKLLLHLPFLHQYGYHRDELYFIACGERPALGYVDHPPLVPMIVRASRELFGDSLIGMRLPGVLVGAATVFLAGFMAHQLGGGPFAQTLGALAILVAPVYLRAPAFVTIPSIEILFWAVTFSILITLLKNDNPRLWPLVGLVVGAGLWTKHTLLFLGFAVAVALLLMPNRRHYAGKWLWIGAFVGLILFLPNLIWQMRHDWPTLEFVRNLHATVMGDVSRVEFLLGQILYMGPMNLPIWLAGLGWLLLAADGRSYRLLGWVFVILVAVFMIAGSKVYYLAPAYPILAASGAVAIEAFARRRAARWIRPVLVAVLVTGGVVFFPIALPVLPIDTMNRYVMIVLGRVLNSAQDITGDLHAEFGWKEQVAAVAGVYHNLPSDQRSPCAILTGNYGEAGAIDLYGGVYGLPKAICTHNNYYLWGPGNAAGDVAIAIGISRRALEDSFASVKQKAVAVSEHGADFENNLPVYLCKDLKLPLAEVWSRAKKYN
jgi:hypothetical protein